MRLRYGRNFSNRFIANLLLSLLLREFSKSVNSWEIMAKKEQSVMVFRLTEYSRHRIERVSFTISINFRIWNDNALLLAGGGRWKCGSGKCRSGKCRSDNVWKAVRRENSKIPVVYAKTKRRNYTRPFLKNVVYV